MEGIGGVKREGETLEGQGEKRAAVLNPLHEDGAALEPLELLPQALMDPLAHHELPSEPASVVPPPRVEVVTLEQFQKEDVFAFESESVVGLSEAQKAARHGQVRNALNDRQKQLRAAFDARLGALRAEKAALHARRVELERRARLEDAAYRQALRDATGVFVLSQEEAGNILHLMMATNECRNYFNVPVDPQLHNVPNYPSVIPRPMDFGTIRSNFEAGVYRDTDGFIADVRQVFRNCESFNGPVHEATVFALHASRCFEAAIRDPGNARKLIYSNAPPPVALAPLRKQRSVKANDDDDDFGGEPSDEAGGGKVDDFTSQQLTHVKQFVQTLQARPQLLERDPRLHFFRQFLASRQ